MYSDIEISQKNKPIKITDIAHKLGLSGNDLDLYGNYKAKIHWDAIKKAKHNSKLGKLILVTSISPTPAGEGKTTISIGLGDAINNQLHKKTIIALREPSLGPVFGLKGGATGGGYAQVVPMEDINLHFTGDMHALTCAIDTLAALVDNYIYQNNECNLDPNSILLKRGIDVNDRTLRKIIIGQGSKFNGIERPASFAITVANELMAILCLSKDINDLKYRIGNILVGFSTTNKPIYVHDLGFEGSIAALLGDALKPNLVQTLEKTPTLIHGGPFANIAHGANSIIATNLALHLSDYVLTEAGFGADLGGQKFMDFVSDHLEKTPDAVVIVATVRALKYQHEKSTTNLANENIESLTAGFVNLKRHMHNMKLYNIPVIVLINKFDTDTDAELRTLQELIKAEGFESEIVNYHDLGSKGGIVAAQKVIDLADNNTKEIIKTYDPTDNIKAKIEKIAKNIYHATNVVYSEKAEKHLENIKKLGKDDLPPIMAKTQISFTDDKKQLGAPDNFTLHVKNVSLKNGAGFIVVYTGNIVDMPGLPKKPAALNIDIDNDGKISGLF
ncbi:MAG: formate--tetrahydrofolate ligase [Lactobacillus iners]|jgi:formate--tetrahydrofolate ligase|uniref:formate--tetrahydrofolate ligase n=1 Tax=Lactobacillus iners TaxID=147802 RepID=UPI0001E5D765|nr:formate--tetrahydrofolate ligase [Lactobacillus iners]EFO66187.1 formate--tetrahydrofolate ligase [Lactobacillus iners LactinV 11V1-d]EGC79195.1 formate--tetrahydrofolate ligase [Lactobacillus iners UPII 143-D]MCT7685070.1 formate--tetrahydrofolate ligase [Lactobacillus iners]MCT7716214.1 formate--tetrahydrofolate ligase [Lactobacillus iners]MCT7779511.1 formate--tetrahydrofolate ligase [Lactobacillus iners]